MNVLTLDGNLAADPSELRKAGEAEVLEFRLAHNPGKDQEPVFITVEVWNGWARNFTGEKGDAAVVTGELRESRWKTKDGETRSRLFVRAREVKLLQKKERSQSDAE